jgi:serine/threonine-protein kinase
MINITYEWNRDAAVAEFQRAIDLSPGLVQAHSWYSFFCLASWDGRFDEAIAEGHRAVELDPLSSYPMTMLALVLGMAGQYEDALSAAKMSVDREPYSFLTWRNLSLVYRWNRRHADAVSAAEKALTVAGRHHWALGDLGFSYAGSGRVQEAEAICSELIERARVRGVERSALAMLVGALDRTDEAFKHLDRAYKERDPILSTARHWPDYEPLRDDPRWAALMKRMGWE